MQGVFLYHKNIDANNMTGVEKKVALQVQEFNKCGIDCRLESYNNRNHGKYRRMLKGILSKFPWTNGYPAFRYSDNLSNVDFIYFRRPSAISKDLIKTLKTIKSENPSIKIIMEIPNYPYEQELKLHIINRGLIIKDRINRQCLNKYVDRIAIQNEIESVFGIKTIKFTNGIDVSSIMPRCPQTNDGNSVNICAVASLEPWQGYERVIKGLSNYYKNGGNRIINIRIAGNGTELSSYKKMVEEYNLSERISFLGRLSGDKLDELYSISDIALDAFGRYKTGNYLSTSLKSREYLSKGIPIITGCKTDILLNHFDYYLELPNDSTEIDFTKVLAFYDKVYSNEISIEEVIGKIREYAEANCGISKMMEPIINYIKS